MAGNSGYTELTSGQANKESTANANFSLFDALATAELDVYISGSTSPPVFTISAANLFDYAIFNLKDDDTVSPADPATQNFTVQLPSGTSRGLIAISNETSFTATIEISGQSKTKPTVAAGASAIVVCDGVNVTAP